MAKAYNAKTFAFFLNNQTVFVFHCDTTDTRNGFYHFGRILRVAGADSYTKSGRLSYQNRTWERFDYEALIRHLINKMTRITAGVETNEALRGVKMTLLEQLKNNDFNMVALDNYIARGQ